MEPVVASALGSTRFAVQPAGGRPQARSRFVSIPSGGYVSPAISPSSPITTA